ncbi:MAG TPA: HlyD family type I secretion periplasmic adaptor subunit [Hyphomicrobiales bacterium]|nr:HlyD family type I secretion periplasmic adaptor subunit [Hyphomicrobiales bacterium]
MTDPAPHTALWSIRRHLAIALAIGLALVFGAGTWAAVTRIAGAVIASGTLVVQSDVKKVQHPTGGVVKELFVRNGDRVHTGEVLIRLDDTQTKANLAIIERALDELAAQRARLEAEQEGAATIDFPPGLLARRSDPEVDRVVSGEQRLFDSRRTALRGQKSQLEERVAQLHQQIDGLNAVEAAKSDEIALNGKELDSVTTLWKKNLVPISKVTEVERTAAQLKGDKGQLVASVAEAKGKIAEMELQIIQLDKDQQSQDGKDLADIRGKTSELVEREIAAKDQLNRIDIRSPQDGFVHELAVHAPGAVISPGEQIMLIVPSADQLLVEAKVSPHDIEDVHLGQMAMLRFSSLEDLRSTPEIDGTVRFVSPDIVTDQKTGAAYYVIRIGVPPEELAKLGQVTLIPGMPVEAFVQTPERTVISYLIKPLRDQVIRAFREK